MKKVQLSILIGFVLGLVTSYFTLDYNGWTLNRMDPNGKVMSSTSELDFNLITNGFLLIVGFTILIYILLTVIEKIKRSKSS
ncbi:hypothetical protein ACFSCX_17680 [Bacillus salitolerans]|uniref:Uncharacterized protein n=1 Tax=Bacillus salitolerans TaxID=1437434 RepID=A0ABW4LV72_9BACI